MKIPLIHQRDQNDSIIFHLLLCVTFLFCYLSSAKPRSPNALCLPGLGTLPLLWIHCHYFLYFNSGHVNPPTNKRYREYLVWDIVASCHWILCVATIFFYLSTAKPRGPIELYRIPNHCFRHLNLGHAKPTTSKIYPEKQASRAPIVSSFCRLESGEGY